MESSRNSLWKCRNRTEINIANNAELRANAQHVLTTIRASRPKNTVLGYQPKQEEFKVDLSAFFKKIFNCSTKLLLCDLDLLRRERIL